MNGSLSARKTQTLPPTLSLRWFGHDHLLSLGITEELIQSYLSAVPHEDGFYHCCPEHVKDLAKLAALERLYRRTEELLERCERLIQR